MTDPTANGHIFLAFRVTVVDRLFTVLLRSKLNNSKLQFIFMRQMCSFSGPLYWDRSELAPFYRKLILFDCGRAD